MPGDEANHYYTLIYDAWNRLAKVQDDAETPATVAEYEYDGTNRRIVKLIPNGENWDRTDCYHNNQWQVLEERYSANQVSKTAVATTLHKQYVWSVRYIDALVLRDRDTTGNGELDERLYYLNDANFNVTALVDATGAVVERYVYDAYGKVTFLTGDWAKVGGTGTASTYANEILYCGYRYDPETGLYHVRNRMYHPTLGRWVQRDVDYYDGMSLYEYVRSGPITHTDPNGTRVLLLAGMWQGVGTLERFEAIIKRDLFITDATFSKNPRRAPRRVKFVKVGANWTNALNTTWVSFYEKPLRAAYAQFKMDKALDPCDQEQFIAIGHSHGATAIYNELRKGTFEMQGRYAPAFFVTIDMVLYDKPRDAWWDWFGVFNKPDLTGKIPQGAKLYNFYQEFDPLIKGRFIKGADWNRKLTGLLHRAVPKHRVLQQVGAWVDMVYHNRILNENLANPAAGGDRFFKYGPGKGGTGEW